MTGCDAHEWMEMSPIGNIWSVQQNRATGMWRHQRRPRLVAGGWEQDLDWKPGLPEGWPE